MRYTEDGKKVRVSKASGTLIPKPETATMRTSMRPAEPGPADTPATAVAKQTYFPPAHLIPFLSSPAASAASTGATAGASATAASPTLSIYRIRRRGAPVRFARVDACVRVQSAWVRGVVAPRCSAHRLCFRRDKAQRA